jgi:hypothetical protein
LFRRESRFQRARRERRFFVALFVAVVGLILPAFVLGGAACESLESRACERGNFAAGSGRDRPCGASILCEAFARFEPAVFGSASSCTGGADSEDAHAFACSVDQVS